jgi:hypothetical protein
MGKLCFILKLGTLKVQAISQKVFIIYHPKASNSFILACCICFNFSSFSFRTLSSCPTVLSIEEGVQTHLRVGGANINHMISKYLDGILKTWHGRPD